MMKKRVTVTTMMMAVLLSWPTEALCQTKVTAGKDVKTIGVKAAAEGAQEAVTEIDEEGREVTADEGSTVRVTGNAPEEGQAARLKLTLSKAPGSEEVKLQSFDIIGDDYVIGGHTIKFTLSVYPANATGKNLTWSVEDCDKDGQLLGTHNNAVLINRELTGIRKGYVLVTAEAKDGSGVKGSKKVEVKSDCPPETSAIGGGESAAFFSPGVPSKPSLVDANPNSDEMRWIKNLTNDFKLDDIKSFVPRATGKLVAYNTIISKKALRLVNYHQGKSAFISCNVNMNCNLGVPGEQVVFLMLYFDTNNGNLTGDAVNAELASNDIIDVTLPADIATAIRGKNFWGIVVKQLGL